MKRVMLLISIILFSIFAIYARPAEINLSEQDIKSDIEDVEHIGTIHPDDAIAIRRYAKADKQLNTAYKMLMDLYDRLDKESISNAEYDKRALQAAQLAWIKYRDLAVESELKVNMNRPRYVRYKSMAALTEQRIERMKSMLENISDYFGYNGSNDKENPAKLALDKLEKMEEEKKENR